MVDEQHSSQVQFTVYTCKPLAGKGAWTAEDLLDSWYCRRVKKLLNSYCKEVDVTDDVEQRAKLAIDAKSQRLPQVYVGKEWLGDYKMVALLVGSGQLDLSACCDEDGPHGIMGR